MTEQKRITPEQVKAAYAETGIKPLQCEWNSPLLPGQVCDTYSSTLESERPCVAGCAFTALFVQATGKRFFTGDDVEAWARNEYGGEYRDSFINGFDDWEEGELVPSPYCSVAFTDGWYVADLIFSEGVA